jgi:hypothetical protein
MASLGPILCPDEVKRLNPTNKPGLVRALDPFGNIYDYRGKMKGLLPGREDRAYAYSTKDSTEQAYVIPGRFVIVENYDAQGAPCPPGIRPTTIVHHVSREWDENGVPTIVFLYDYDRHIALLPAQKSVLDDLIP